MDDFEAFRKKKLLKKRVEKEKSERESYYEIKVEEEGKVKGLTGHRQKLRNFTEDEIPEVKGFDSHISRAEEDPEGIEKWDGKRLWGDDLARVDPESVEKMKGRISHRSDLQKVDPDSIKRPPGLKRW